MNDIEALLEKYYRGETSLDEERRIQEHFAARQENGIPDARLFNAIKAAQSHADPRPASKPRLRYGRYIAVAGPALAAGIALLLVLRQTPALPTPADAAPQSLPAATALSTTILVNPEVSGEIKDEQLALEQARKTLAYVSRKLNKGLGGIQHFSKLEKSVAKIQNKEKS